MPTRCALAREAEYFDEEIRQLIFRSHRIVFRIEEEARIVRVVYILHGKQLALHDAKRETIERLHPPPNVLPPHLCEFNKRRGLPPPQNDLQDLPTRPDEVRGRHQRVNVQTSGKIRAQR